MINVNVTGTAFPVYQIKLNWVIKNNSSDKEDLPHGRNEDHLSHVLSWICHSITYTLLERECGLRL